nr:hypothetical protein [Chloracidobacterium aggregatum]
MFDVQHDATRPGLFDQLFGVGERQRQRVVHTDRFAGRNCRLCHAGMVRVGRTHHDGIHIRARNGFLPVFSGCRRNRECQFVGPIEVVGGDDGHTGIKALVELA